MKSMIKKRKVKVKKIRQEAILPAYATKFSAGADLYACLDEEKVSFAPGETKLIHTGVSMEIPEGLAGFIYARSSVASKRGLAPANKVGVIDSDYRGEIMVALHNHSDAVQEIENGGAAYRRQAGSFRGFDMRGSLWQLCICWIAQLFCCRGRIFCC